MTLFSTLMRYKDRMDDLTEIQVDLIRNSLYLDAAVYLLGLNSLT
jgi:hypothetical protein